MLLRKYLKKILGYIIALVKLETYHTILYDEHIAT